MKPTCKANLKNSLFEKIDKADVVSFDVFDTLLLRPFVHPFDVFSYLEYFFAVPGFRAARLQAEPAARLKYPQKSEITLQNIYECMPEPFRFIQEHEQAFELTVLQANAEMAEVFNYAKQRGKKIFIISDMYLPKSVIEQALIKNGLGGYDKVFVSSDTGCRKSDGALFEYVKKQAGVAPHKMLHIGDNPVSDYEVPLKLGFDAFLYPSVTQAFFATEEGLKAKKIYETPGTEKALLSLLIGLQLLNRQNRPQANSYWETLGYAVGGAFIYAYVKFIADALAKTSATDCLFVARDGYMLSKVFALFPEAAHIKNHYVYAPRFVRILGLCDGLDNEGYFRYFKTSLAERFPQDKDGIEAAQTPAELLQKDTVKAYCAGVLNGYKQYLNKAVQPAGEQIYMVDLGSNSASSQKLLTALRPGSLRAGFYFALNPKTGVPAFVYDTSKTHLVFEEFMEFLITAPDTTAVAFAHAEPVLKTPDPKDEQNAESIRLLQKGEWNFCKDIKAVLGRFEKPVAPEILKTYMNLFFEYATPNDKAHLQNVYWFYTADHRSAVSFLDILQSRYPAVKKQKFRLKFPPVIKWLKNIFKKK